MESNGRGRWSPLERVRKAALAQNAPQRLLIPELPNEDGQPLEIFWTPLTGIDEQTIENREPKTGAERATLRFILKARNDEGRALFRWDDCDVLMKELPFNVILRVVNAVMDAKPATVEEAKSLIEADPPCTSDSTLPSSSTAH